MKIHTIDAAVWWIVIADEIRPRDGTALQNWIVKLQAVFKFAQTPVQLPQSGQGFDFIEGSFEYGGDIIPINKLSVYQDGFSIVVNGDTTRAERVLQEITNIFYSIGYRKPHTPPTRYYVSKIVADFERPLDNLFPSAILKKISAAMSIVGDAHLMTFRTNADPDSLPRHMAPINPTIFTIERRGGQIPFELNHYFCEANTATKKHIELLEEIERSV